MKELCILVRRIAQELFGEKQIDLTEIPDLRTLIRKYPNALKVTVNGVPIRFYNTTFRFDGIPAPLSEFLIRRVDASCYQSHQKILSLDISLLGKPLLFKGEIRFVNEGWYVERRFLTLEWLKKEKVTVGPTCVDNIPSEERTFYYFLNEVYQAGR